MPKIYKRSDRIKVKIDDVVVTLAPLSYDQKVDLQHDIITGQKQGDYKIINRGLVKALKHGLKDVEGIENADGSKYVLQFENNEVTDECVSDLFNMEIQEKLVMVFTSLVRGIPSEFTDQHGKKLEGVEILPSESAKGKQETPNS